MMGCLLDFGGKGFILAAKEMSNWKTRSRLCTYTLMKLMFKYDQNTFDGLVS